MQNADAWWLNTTYLSSICPSLAILLFWNAAVQAFFRLVKTFVWVIVNETSHNTTHVALQTQSMQRGGRWWLYNRLFSVRTSATAVII